MQCWPKLLGPGLWGALLLVCAVTPLMAQSPEFPPPGDVSANYKVTQIIPGRRPGPSLRVGVAALGRWRPTKRQVFFAESGAARVRLFRLGAPGEMQEVLTGFATLASNRRVRRSLVPGRSVF